MHTSKRCTDGSSITLHTSDIKCRLCGGMYGAELQPLLASFLISRGIWCDSYQHQNTSEILIYINAENVMTGYKHCWLMLGHTIS